MTNMPVHHIPRPRRAETYRLLRAAQPEAFETTAVADSTQHGRDPAVRPLRSPRYFDAQVDDLLQSATIEQATGVLVHHPSVSAL